jgi:hypothetical protein
MAARRNRYGPFSQSPAICELILLPQEIVTLKRKSKEIILRPAVFDRLLGALNLTVLASLSWFAYDRWNDPRVWTRRNISVTSLGLLAWFGGQATVSVLVMTKETTSAHVYGTVRDQGEQGEEVIEAR